MFLLLHTLAAIANIVANNHNFFIDYERNPYLRVKRSIDTPSIPRLAEQNPEINKISDVKVTLKDIDYLPKSIESVDFKRKQFKLNRDIPKTNLYSDVDVNIYIDTKSIDNNFALDTEPIEFNINKLYRKHNVDVINTLFRTNRGHDKENGSEQSYSTVINQNNLDKKSANVYNNFDKTIINARTVQKKRHKRSYYVPILRPDYDLDRNEEDSQVTTPRVQITTEDAETTINEDTNKTSTSADKQTSTTPLYDDYDNSDYDNGGYFVRTPPKKVDFNGRNKTDKYPIIGNNHKTNKTQAYYPLSHTYIPGYNKPDDVFNFEKGPVFTNKTGKSNEKNETNPLKSDENLRESNITKEESESEDSDIDRNNLERPKRSYYIQKSNRPGAASSYYPLSHTYIPGYNTRRDGFDFEQDSDLPYPKNESHEDKNDTKGDRANNSDDKNKKNIENTTKQAPHKNKITKATSSYSPTTKKSNKRDDYDYGGDFFQTPKSHSINPSKYQPNNKNKDDSLDYKNDGDFIVRVPNNRNQANQKPVNRRYPNHNNKQNGAHHYVPPHPTAIHGQWRWSTTKKNIKTGSRVQSTTESNPRYRISRLKRGYYMAVYENENTGRKRVKGYYPLSHTYIPGYNEQSDVWNYEGGNVYPYPNNKNGHDRSSADNQPQHRQDHRKKPKEHKIEEATDNKRYNTRNNGRGNHETKDDDNKDESLLSKIVNPIKKLFGYRKKRNIQDENYNNAKADDAIIVRKRNGVTDFFNNMFEKVYNYTRREQTVVIDENNLYNPSDKDSNTDAIASGVHSDEYGKKYLYNPYSSRYATYESKYPDYNRKTHTSSYQDPYGYSQYNQYRKLTVNNTPFNNINYINYNSLSQKPNHNGNEDATERNDIETDEVNGIDDDGDDDDDTTETEGILKETCFMCRSAGCPINHKRRGFVCVPIKYKKKIN